MWQDYKEVFYENDKFLKTVESMQDLENYELHENCEIIGDSTFHGNEKLTTFVCPKNLQTIEIEAFVNCSHLKKVVFNEGLKRIEENAFGNCSSLSSIILPNSLEYIGPNAFVGGFDVIQIRIGENLKEILSDVFYGDGRINEIDLNKVEHIHAHAFGGYSIGTLKLPSTLKSIDKYAFCSDCEIDRIIFEGTKGMLERVEGGSQFYKKYSDKIKFNVPTLEEMIDKGFSLKEITTIYNDNKEER